MKHSDIGCLGQSGQVWQCMFDRRERPGSSNPKKVLSGSAMATTTILAPTTLRGGSGQPKVG